MGAIIKILSEMGLGKWALIVLGLSIFVDLSPIKLNPIKAIISFIGKYFNNAVQGKIDEFEVKVNTKIDNFQSEINVKLDQLQKEQNAQQRCRDRKDQVDKRPCAARKRDLFLFDLCRRFLRGPAVQRDLFFFDLRRLIRRDLRRRGAALRRERSGLSRFIRSCRFFRCCRRCDRLCRFGRFCRLIRFFRLCRYGRRRCRDRRGRRCRGRRCGRDRCRRCRRAPRTGRAGPARSSCWWCRRR